MAKRLRASVRGMDCHKNLEYLCSAKRLNSRQVRLALFFRQFNFSLTYRPGSRNVKPDALSQQFSPDLTDPDSGPILYPSCIVGAATWQVEERVHEVQCSIPSLMETPPNRLFVPEPVRSEVLLWGHSSRLACHPGLARILHLLRQRFWWPPMVTHRHGLCDQSTSFQRSHCHPHNCGVLLQVCALCASSQAPINGRDGSAPGCPHLSVARDRAT